MHVVDSTMSPWHTKVNQLMNVDVNRKERAIMQRIKGYRVMLNLSQQDVAKELGISRQSYWSKENGRTSFNDKEKTKIRDLFRKTGIPVTIDSLFFDGKVD